MRKQSAVLGRRGTVLERFWVKVRVTESGCWTWTGSVSEKGYALFAIPGRASKRAHRWSYEHFVGPIPDGMQLDHLCRNRACVNPAHLEPVTNRENTIRGLVARGVLRAAS